jgi:hypothetical protein
VIHAAASERYNTRFEDAMTRRLGVRFVERADSVRDDKRVIREIARIPDVLRKHFSKRRVAIEDRYRTLASDYRRSHGHEPPRKTQLKLAQQATLETRDAKSEPQSLAERLTAWRDEAAAVLGERGLARLETDAFEVTTRPAALADLDVAELAKTVVSRVSAEKATWTRWNLLAETERQLRPLHFSTVADRQAVTDLVLEHALRPEVAVQAHGGRTRTRCTARGSRSPGHTKVERRVRASRARRHSLHDPGTPGRRATPSQVRGSAGPVSARSKATVSLATTSHSRNSVVTRGSRSTRRALFTGSSVS